MPDKDVKTEELTSGAGYGRNRPTHADTKGNALGSGSAYAPRKRLFKPDPNLASKELISGASYSGNYLNNVVDPAEVYENQNPNTGSGWDCNGSQGDNTVPLSNYDHNTLLARDAPDTHPIDAITGLREELIRASRGNKTYIQADMPTDYIKGDAWFQTTNNKLWHFDVTAVVLTGKDDTDWRNIIVERVNRVALVFKGSDMTPLDANRGRNALGMMIYQRLINVLPDDAELLISSQPPINMSNVFWYNFKANELMYLPRRVGE